MYVLYFTHPLQVQDEPLVPLFNNFNAHPRVFDWRQGEVIYIVLSKVIYRVVEIHTKINIKKEDNKISNYKQIYS